MTLLKLDPESIALRNFVIIASHNVKSHGTVIDNVLPDLRTASASRIIPIKVRNSIFDYALTQQFNIGNAVLCNP
jgi:hypothetical protein